MIDLRKIFSSNFRYGVMSFLSFLPDKMYLRLFYFSTTGKLINFKNPRGFNEKLQWLKVYDRHLEYSELVDKLAVRSHIKEKLGEKYLFTLIGYYKTFDEIDFSKLPDSFVMKCNHDSGSTKVIKDKDALTQNDINNLREHFTRRLKRDFFYAGREYPYKGIKPCIMIEKMMVNKDNPEKSIEDFKFFCFDGEPKIMFVATDREADCKFDFYDMDFNHLDIYNIHPNSDKSIEKPDKFEEMKEIAAKLSKGIKHVRIDLYELDGQIYFGEYTFFHGGGFQLFHPEKWEKQLGDWIKLN